MLRRAIATATATFATAATALAGGSTFNVPADFPTIQDAIDASADFDTIVVAPGTYAENLSYFGKRITVRSTNPASPAVVASTVIDAAMSGSCVVFLNGESAESVLDGLTLINGSSTNGGAIIVNNSSSPTVSNCVIRNNTAGSNGGGAFISNSSMPAFVDCTFMMNSALQGGAVLVNNAVPSFDGCDFIMNSANPTGGAINFLGSAATLTDCTFQTNSAVNGGAIFSSGTSAPVFMRCAFSSNNAANGGALFGLGTQGGFDACRFEGNVAMTDGGALFYTASSTPLITNSIFSGNSCMDEGGAIYCTSDTNAAVVNCTFENNAAPIGAAMTTEVGAAITCASTIIWNNGPNPLVAQVTGSFDISYSNIEGGFTGAANIDADPLFVNVSSGNYSLAAGSPCIDAGDNDAIPGSIGFDIDGNPRRIDDPGTADTGNGFNPVVDMGAHEFVPQSCPGDCDDDGDVDFNDLVCALFLFGPCP